jgi:hypothetical protein
VQYRNKQYFLFYFIFIFILLYLFLFLFYCTLLRHHDGGSAASQRATAKGGGEGGRGVYSGDPIMQGMAPATNNVSATYIDTHTHTHTHKHTQTHTNTHKQGQAGMPGPRLRPLATTTKRPTGASRGGGRGGEGGNRWVKERKRLVFLCCSRTSSRPCLLFLNSTPGVGVGVGVGVCRCILTYMCT